MAYKRTKYCYSAALGLCQILFLLRVTAIMKIKMIGFVKLNFNTLMELKIRGYNILRSPSYLCNKNPTWIPDYVDVSRFFELDTDEIAKISGPLVGKHFLLIEDALENSTNEDLIGEVLVHDEPMG